MNYYYKYFKYKVKYLKLKSQIGGSDTGGQKHKHPNSTSDVTLKPVPDCNEQTLPLEQEDIDLIDSVRRIMKERADVVSRTVFCGLRDNTGEIFYGCNIKNQNAHSSCAEPSALSFGEIYSRTKNYVTIVAINFKNDSIIPPCGICRELLNLNCPNINVIIPTQDEPKKIKAKYLLPYPYFSSKQSDKRLEAVIDHKFCVEGAM